MFDGRGFDDWKIKIQPIFGFHDIVEVVMIGLEDPRTKAIDEAKNLQKLDSKAKFLIYQ